MDVIRWRRVKTVKEENTRKREREMKDVDEKECGVEVR